MFICNCLLVSVNRRFKILYVARSILIQNFLWLFSGRSVKMDRTVLLCHFIPSNLVQEQDFVSNKSAISKSHRAIFAFGHCTKEISLIPLSCILQFSAFDNNATSSCKPMILDGYYLIQLRHTRKACRWSASPCNAFCWKRIQYLLNN